MRDIKISALITSDKQIEIPENFEIYVQIASPVNWFDGTATVVIDNTVMFVEIPGLKNKITADGAARKILSYFSEIVRDEVFIITGFYKNDKRSTFTMGY